MFSEKRDGFLYHITMGFNFSHRSKISSKTSSVLRGRMKLAGLFAMSEEEFEGLLASVEGSERFNLLRKTGVLSVAGFSKARFNARNFAGYGLRMEAGGLPELVDGKYNYARLIQGIGREKFETLFLKNETLSDAERAEECGISEEDSKKIREFLNRVFIQAEFASPAAGVPPAAVYSAVAGVEIENGKPVLGFFNREVWKGRYSVNEKKLAMYISGVSEKEAAAARELIKRVGFLEQRKTTLYAALEKLIAAQADYLLTGEPAKRRPYTQRVLAKELGVHASVLNRLVSNKSVQLPWGMETPMSELLPSEKKINREKLYAIMIKHPQSTDADLARLLERVSGKKISRRSINQYRRELINK